VGSSRERLAVNARVQGKGGRAHETALAIQALRNLKERRTEMKNVPKLLLAAITLSALTLPALAIINGEVDTENEFPNVGTILLVVPPLSQPELPVPRVQCSCTLIAPNVVLTAGHCADLFQRVIGTGEVTLDNFRVSVGAADAFDPDTWLELEAIITHPDFDPNSLHADLGAIILAEPAQGVEPAALPALGMLDELREAGEFPPTEAVFTIAGYGRFDHAIPPDGRRRFAPTGYIALDPRRLILNANPVFGFGNGAQFDSGGACIYTAEDGTRTLVATWFWSIGEGTEALGFTTRLDTQEMIDFIADVLDSAEP
jgi:hypothetical protein